MSFNTCFICYVGYRIWWWRVFWHLTEDQAKIKRWNPETQRNLKKTRLPSRQNVEFPVRGSAAVCLGKIRKAPTANAGKSNWISTIRDIFTGKRRASWIRGNRDFPRVPRWLNRGKHWFSRTPLHSPQLFPVLPNHTMYVAGLFLAWGYIGDSVNNPTWGI